MYHFVSEQTPELRLADNALVSSHTTQYLKGFQIEAVRFLYDQLSKQEFCILNDESGLGKSASIAALLSAVGTSKKTLIVLQNDDQLLVGWQFHFNILTELPVCVIQNITDSTESAHNVYLAKWSVLRGIGDLSKLSFDYVIVDHRGHTLNNNFCTSMLLKQFERKVNIVISSIDITSDVKLLYNALRMGGHLEHQFKSFRSFEQKFHLADAKEVFNKRIDLEEYYRQRGILGEYVKSFRLRRYRHQFDQLLPLVTPEQFKTNVALWLASNNNSNSTLSDTTIASTIGSSSTDVRATAATEEIMECLMGIKREREFAERADPEKLSDHSDEVIAMSPLVFEMSDSEEPPAVLLSSDDCEIVTPPTTPPLEPAVEAKSAQKVKRKYTKKPQATAGISEVARSSSKKTNKAELPAPPTLEPQPAKVAVAVTPKKLVERTPKRQSRDPLLAPGVHTRETRGMQRLTRSADSRTRNSKYMTSTVALDIDKKPTPRKKPKSDANQTPRTSKARAPATPPAKPAKEVSSPTTSRTRLLKEKDEVSAQIKPAKEMSSPTTSRTRVLKEKEEVSAQTKPAPKPAKEMSSPTTSRTRVLKGKEEVSAQTKPAPKPKRGRPTLLDKVEAAKNQVSQAKQQEKVKIIADPKGKAKAKAGVEPPTPTPQLLSSGSTNSDYSFLQCGQKLPANLNQLDVLETPSFRIPPTPQSSHQLLPSTLNIFSDSEVAFVPSSNAREVIVISSSHDESSEQSATQSRRTRALKRKRKSAPPAISHEKQQQPSTSSFGELLAQQRAQNKSPDIFSNCSDMSQLLLNQPAAASSFEGFKIFGSEVKQLQQQHAQPQASGSTKKKRERSCLDLLEQMFEPRGEQRANNSNNVLPTYPPTVPPSIAAPLEDDIFEITNNGEFGSRLRLNSNGNVSPVQQRSTQHNKITNYLIGSSATLEDEMLPASNRQASALRKSPKGIKSTQSTKLTRWFGAAATSSMANSGESLSAPSTPMTQTSSAACQAARRARSSGPTKRKRLELFK